MSAQHTQGRLVAAHEVLLLDDSKGEFGDVASLVGCANAEANARRLAACWNACEGITTERLEDLGRPLLQHLIGCDQRAARMVQERRELETQRDELLAALSVLQSHCESMAAANWRKWEELASPKEFERWVKSRAAHMAAQAKAAIANVEGGA